MAFFTLLFTYSPEKVRGNTLIGPLKGSDTFPRMLFIIHVSQV